MTESVDVVILGGGPNAPYLAERLTQGGYRTVLIQPANGPATRDELMFRAMAESAGLAWKTRHLAAFGLRGAPASVDFRAVRNRAEAAAVEAAQDCTTRLARCAALTQVRGKAHMVAPGTVQVGRRLISATHTIFDLPTRPAIPAWPGLDSVSYLVPADLRSLTRLPDHLAIIGGEALSLELAQLYARLGTKVTLICETETLLPQEDPEASALIAALLAADGVSLHLGSQVEAVSRAGHGIIVSLAARRQASIEASHLLFTQAQPASAELDLPAAGLVADSQGRLPVDLHGRTPVSGHWAIGAVAQGQAPGWETVAASILADEMGAISPGYADAILIDPPFARLGPSLSDLSRHDRELVHSSRPLRGGKAAGDGFLRVSMDRSSGELLGLALLAPQAVEVASALSPLVGTGLPSEYLVSSTHLPSTLADTLAAILSELALPLSDRG